MLRNVFAAFVVLALLLTVGCASQGRRVPTDVEAVQTHDFNPTDLQIVSEKAVYDLMARNVFPVAPKPIVYVAKVRNLTNEHINGEMIVEKIAYVLSESNKVVLVDPKTQDEAIRQLQFQQGALVNPETAKKIGKMLGADFFIQGELANMESRAGGRKGQYFLLTLTLANIETNQVWKSQVEIQKLSKRGFFGW